MSLRQCCGMFFIALISGCATFQDSEYKTAQYWRSHCAWWRNPCDRCSANPVSHYSKGWRQGYADVLMGGDGTCPPVPPHCYWSHKFQNCYGEQAIDDWFKGYHDGANSGLASGRGTYHTVPISDMYRQDGGCLPADDSPYPHGRTTLEVRNVEPQAARKSLKSEKIKQVSNESILSQLSPSKAPEDKTVETDATVDQSDDESSID